MSNVQFAKDIYTAFGRGDIPTVLAGFRPEIEWRQAEGNPYNPDGSAWIGPQTVLEKLFMRLGSEWDGFTVNVRTLHDAGEHVVMEGRYRCRRSWHCGDRSFGRKMRDMSIPRIGACLTVLLLAGPGLAYAQTTGTLCGTVTDPSGIGKPGVSVALTLRGPDMPPPTTSTYTATNAAGDYLFSNVPTGTYSVTFELAGFKKVNHPGVIVTASPHLHIDQRMEPSARPDEPIVVPVPSVAYDRPRTTGGTFTKEIVMNPVPPRPCGAPR
jgi:hypothetical protein